MAVPFNLAGTGPRDETASERLERDLEDAEREIAELKRITHSNQGLDLAHQITALERRAEALREAIASNPTPWQTVQIARHPERPKIGAYIAGLMADFVELHGDRAFRDDPAIVAGLGTVDGRTAAVIGHAKGRDTRENIARNFGMPNPEGYRKAVRIMRLAERLRAPVITLIDTPGAFPGKEAEERGQSEAIARALIEMSRLRTPIITVITGEGGSGGALAIGVGDVVMMLERAVYSVISPEGCAAILWRDGTRGREAARALGLTARDLVGFGIVDEIIPEPPGGAHRHPDQAVAAVGVAIRRHLGALVAQPVETVVNARYKKFRRIGRLRDLGQISEQTPSGHPLSDRTPRTERGSGRVKGGQRDEP
jgi:acetyl-CoA carboxylase carboxyl transferase subunit alpha